MAEVTWSAGKATPEVPLPAMPVCLSVPGPRFCTYRDDETDALQYLAATEVPPSSGATAPPHHTAPSRQPSNRFPALRFDFSPTSSKGSSKNPGRQGALPTFPCTIMVRDQHHDVYVVLSGYTGRIAGCSPTGVECCAAAADPRRHSGSLPPSIGRPIHPSQTPRKNRSRQKLVQSRRPEHQHYTEELPAHGCAEE